MQSASLSAQSASNDDKTNNNAVSYQNSFFRSLNANFDAFLKPSVIPESSNATTRVISKDYFPAIGVLKNNKDFQTAVRDFCVAKLAQGSQLGNWNERVNELVDKEMRERSALRDQVRLYAKKKLHLYCRSNFLEMWKSLSLELNNLGGPVSDCPATVNNVAEIEALLDLLLGWATSTRNDLWTKKILSLIGHLLYGSYQKMRGWELIQESSFMADNSIAYDRIKSKGCIAKSITAEKSEFNKRFLDIALKYGFPLTSRVGKNDEVSHRRQARSADFYVASKKIKRKRAVDDPPIDYMLVSMSDTQKLSTALPQNESDNQFLYSTATMPPLPSDSNEFSKTFVYDDNDDESIKEYIRSIHPFANLIIRVLVTKLHFLFREGISEEIRMFWFRKILKAVMEAPSDLALPKQYQDMIDMLFKGPLIQNNMESSDEEVSCIDEQGKLENKNLHQEQIQSDDESDDDRAFKSILESYDNICSNTSAKLTLGDIRRTVIELDQHNTPTPTTANNDKRGKNLITIDGDSDPETSSLAVVALDIDEETANKKASATDDSNGVANMKGDVSQKKAIDASEGKMNIDVNLKEGASAKEGNNNESAMNEITESNYKKVGDRQMSTTGQISYSIREQVETSVLDVTNEKNERQETANENKTLTEIAKKRGKAENSKNRVAATSDDGTRKQGSSKKQKPKASTCPLDHSAKTSFKEQADKRYCAPPYDLYQKNCYECGVLMSNEKKDSHFVPSSSKPAYLCLNCPFMCNIVFCHSCYGTKTITTKRFKG